MWVTLTHQNQLSHAQTPRSLEIVREAGDQLPHLYPCNNLSLNCPHPRKSCAEKVDTTDGEKKKRDGDYEAEYTGRRRCTRGPPPSRRLRGSVNKRPATALSNPDGQLYAAGSREWLILLVSACRQALLSAVYLFIQPHGNWSPRVPLLAATARPGQ